MGMASCVHVKRKQTNKKKRLNNNSNNNNYKTKIKLSARLTNHYKKNLLRTCHTLTSSIVEDLSDGRFGGYTKLYKVNKVLDVLNGRR